MLCIAILIGYYSLKIIEIYSFKNMLFAWGYFMNILFYCFAGYYGWDKRLNLITWILFVCTACQWKFVLLVIHLTIKIFLQISPYLLIHILWIPLVLCFTLLSFIIADVTIKTL
eukprot:162821_1